MRTPRWTLISYVFIILMGILAALPNVLPPNIVAQLPVKAVTLGLDLQGGSHLVLEVDRHALVRERIDELAKQTGLELRKAKIKFDPISKQETGLTVSLKDPSDQARAIEVINGLATTSGQGTFQSSAPELEVVATPQGTIAVTLSEMALQHRLSGAVEQSLEIVRRRIEGIGVAEPTVLQSGTDRILVQLPGEQNPKRIRDILKSTAKMTFHLLGDSAAVGRPGSGVTMMPSEEPGRPSYPVLDDVAVSGERLTDAQLGFDNQTKEPVVSFRFDSVGAHQFADITRNNVGQPFAIVLDGKVLSAPRINEPITGGSGQISGGFTTQSASDLAVSLRAGALPVPLTVIDEGTVGADLGSDSIQMGIYTGIAGLALVLAFMVFLYGRWGMVANGALVLNVILTFAALGLLGATLTLPGIAGIVLGVGLAVDANVLINERIREESRKGMSAFAALNAGFNRAYATIVDSNLTALIATALLFMFGEGPVRGFAVTMALGILISMFTAVSVVRVVMTAIVRRRKLKTIRIEPLFEMKLVPDGTKISFMKARFAGIAVSAVLSLASIGLFFSPGLNYGIDFKGGVQLEVTTPGKADLAAMRSGLNDLGLGEVALQEYGGDNKVLVRTELQPGGEEAQTHAVDSIRAKLQEVSPGTTVDRSAVVGPKVGNELAQAGVLAVILSSIAMFVYIWARFEWPFAVGAIATLVLDTTKIVGFFALTGLDFNLTAIAALLTLIGYSVNDKVVVYDRMRENMRLYKQMPMRDMIDRSINETLARSLYTSVTALLAMLPMAIWGGSAVSSFAVPMVVGIVIAASSSVFIAAPILLFLGDWRRSRSKRVALPQTATAA